MQYNLAEIPTGESGTDATVRIITRLINGSLKRPGIRFNAISIIKQAAVPNHDQAAAAVALYNFVKSTIRYLPDPIGVETVQDPEITIKLAAGDCDDHTVLLGALAMSVGIPVRFHVLGFHRDDFKHIYPELQVDGQWVPADTTGKFRMGRRTKLYPAEKIYNYSGEPIMPINGLAGTLPIPKATIERVIFKSTIGTLKRNWNAGLINMRDVESYLRVIDEGNSPGYSTIADPVMRNAIALFRDHLKRTGAISAKPLDQIGDLYGLDGFLSSIWDGVKKAVSGVVRVVGGVVGKGIQVFTGGGGGQAAPPPVTIQMPDVDLSLIKTTTPPEAVRAGVLEMFKNPVVLMGLGLMTYLVFIKKG